MKKSKYLAYSFRNNKRLFKTTSLFFVILLILQLYLLPSVYSITVEEQAGSRQRRGATYSDEFSNKAPERRDADRNRQERDPRLACLLSLMLPGGGHIYLRKDFKGISFCLLTVGFYSSAAYYLYIGWTGDSSGTERKSKIIVSGVLAAVAVIFHVVGVVEAYNDAIEINETKYFYGKRKSKSPYIAKLLFE